MADMIGKLHPLAADRLNAKPDAAHGGDHAGEEDDRRSRDLRQYVHVLICSRLADA